MCLALPAEVVQVRGNEPLTREAQVDFGGVRRRISLACLPEAQVGDWVLVHAGVAISRLDEEAARAIIADLHRLTELDQEEP